jgi:hypothetical protein
VSDWWQKKLGQDRPPALVPGIPVHRTGTPQQPFQAPVQRPVAVPQQHYPGQQQDAETVDVATRLRQHIDYIPDRAIANKTETMTCPGCGSGNWYTGVSQGAPVAGHCFDCGYPKVQAGSGLGALAGSAASGPAQRAPQTGSSGWHPQEIIGRIG